MTVGVSSAALAARYAACAAAATAANVATQRITSALYAGRFELYAAMAAGTLTGLVAKYLLDRRWIFPARRAALGGHAVAFARYTLTGAATTCLFWGTELAFAALGDARWLRYAGAVLGLTVGYLTKYRLDRRFVFREPAA